MLEKHIRGGSIAPGEPLVGGKEEGIVGGREGGRGGGRTAASAQADGGRGPGHAQLEGRVRYLYLAGGVAAQPA